MTREIEAQRRLRAALVEAAEREIGPVRKRRRTRRGLIVALAGLGIAGGAATAADLISIGEPETQRNPRPERYRPIGTPEADVVAADSPLPWATRAYRSASGDACAIVGQLRGRQLGVIRDGRFRPYEAGVSGACSALRDAAFFVDRRVSGDRTVLFGRARRSVVEMIVRQPGEPTATARVGPLGSYLFVFEGTLAQGAFTVSGRTRDGRELTE